MVTSLLSKLKFWQKDETVPSATNDILRRADLVGKDTARLENEIIEFVENNLVTRAVQRNFRTDAVKQPFNHIMVVGERDYDNAWKQNLQSALANRLYKFDGEFEVSILNRATGQTAVYCGLGVFSPPVTGCRVGVLEFTGVDPASRRDVPIDEPLLHGLEDRSRAHAGWYEQQQGLVCAFNPEIAPAVLDIENLGFSTATKEIVRDCSFFLGRYDNLGQAEFLVHRHTQSGAMRFVHANLEGKGGNWAQKNGHWQKVTFDGGPHLWVRYRSFSGYGGGFVPDGVEDVAGSLGGMAKIKVHGIVVPKISATAGLFSPNLPNKWWLEFSGNGLLAHSPLAQRTYAASGASMGRFAIYARDVDDWRGLVGSPSGIVESELTDGRWVGTRQINMLKALSDRKQAKQLRGLLGAEVRFLHYTRDNQDFGHFYVPAGGVVSRFHAHPVESGRAGGVDISLDWLNRAGGVETRNDYTGLAQFWLANKTLQARFVDDALHVTFSGEQAGWRHKKLEARTVIESGKRGFLGPLWVEVVAPAVAPRAESDDE